MEKLQKETIHRGLVHGYFLPTPPSHIHLATCNDILLWMPILNMIIQVLQFLEVLATVGAKILRCLVILLMPL